MVFDLKYHQFFTKHKGSGLGAASKTACLALKTWLTGTHHGVKPKYLQGYLDEYVFRFNRRQTPMAAFQTLLGIASGKPQVPLKAFKKVELSA